MVKGIIFDMDGVLVNNMAIHFKAFAAMAERYNLSSEREIDFTHLNGRGNEDIITALFPAELVAEKGIQGLADEKEALYREIYEPTIKPSEGLVELLGEIHNAGLRCAVGSSGPRENVEFVLRKCLIEPFFEVRISGDMVTRCKPDPEIFLSAAAALNLAPEECLVFEDAISGVKAAKAAGMKVITLTTTHTREQLQEAGADIIAEDFTTISLGTILSLYK